MNAQWKESGMGLGRVCVGDQPVTDTIGKKDGRHVAAALNALAEGDESRRERVEAFVDKKFIPQRV